LGLRLRLRYRPNLLLFLSIFLRKPISMIPLIQFQQRLWAPVRHLLELMQSPALLLSRAYVAYLFFASGLTKIKDWDTTLALFTDEYKVPLLSPALAAFMGTAGELALPVLLVAGLGTRFAALGLSVVNVMAVWALQEIAPAALQQHVLWGALLATVAIFGAGALSMERWLTPRFCHLSAR
jgi:putative oxidoreductase